MFEKKETIDSGGAVIPETSWKVGVGITFAFIVSVTFLIFSAYGVWTFHNRSEIKKHINSLTIVNHAQKIQIGKMRKEIQELRLAQRWDILLQTILDPDRQIEFDMIEEHLQKEIYQGKIRNRPEDTIKVKKE